LATAQGIIIGATSNNLADFQQWKRFTTANGLPTQKYKKIVAFENNLFALGENNQLYKYAHLNVWQNILLPTQIFTDLQVGKDNKLYLLAENKVYTIETNSSLTEIALPTPLPKAQSIQTKANGAIWVADAQKGLLKVHTNGWTSHFPNSPASPNAWQVKYAENKIVVTTGGFDNNLQPLQRTSGYATFAEGTWNSVALPTIKDLTAFTYVPQNKTRYFGSYGTGLWEQKEDGTLTQFTASNSPLIASALGDARITALATDSEGKIWVSNHAVGNGQTSLHTRQTDGTWRSFLPPAFAGRNPLDIVIAQNKWKWVRLGSELGGGIWVLNDQNNQSSILNNTPNQGNLPSSIVNAIAEDKEGYIWVGTSRGIAVFYSPEQAFGNINALLPIYEGRPLLRDEVVTALVVDGGNRKWVGTTTGLWLFDAEGTKLIHYFNTENSPLPSNNILNLALHPQTGELFVITDVGMVSYRGTATEASTEFDNAQVFPNPVYPNFDGLVGISGLPTGAKVKITDVSGRLFYETVSQGGTASWNLQDYQGTRAKAGIYLLYVFKADGSQTKVLKVAVLE
jgi:ligand-binding sensor domain-containing protein